jgi:hypothetical protein
LLTFSVLPAPWRAKPSNLREYPLIHPRECDIFAMSLAREIECNSITEAVRTRHFFAGENCFEAVL